MYRLRVSIRYRIGILPSLVPERVRMFTDLSHLMCSNSQNLYKEATNRLFEYKQNITKYNQTKNFEILMQVRKEQAELNINYKRILAISQFIATTPTKHSAFIRKYIEIPHAGCILLANKCGWEDKIFRYQKYPMIPLDTKNNYLSIEKAERAYDQNCSALLNMQKLIQRFGTYQNRIDELISFCFAKT